MIGIAISWALGRSRRHARFIYPSCNSSKLVRQQSLPLISLNCQIWAVTDVRDLSASYFVCCSCVCVCDCRLMWHIAISVKPLHMMTRHSRLFLRAPLPPHPQSLPLPSILHLPYSTPQFLTWPLRPALWPLCLPPQLSLPLRLFSMTAGDWPSVPDTLISFLHRCAPLLSFRLYSSLLFTLFCSPFVLHPF